MHWLCCTSGGTPSGPLSKAWMGAPPTKRVYITATLARCYTVDNSQGSITGPGNSDGLCVRGPWNPSPSV